MSTLRDLRETLDRHADDVDDTQRYVRPVAVRARVRAVRRRRTAAGGVAAALVLAGGITAVSSWDRSERVEPAGPAVIGIDVPEAATIQGFPYELSGSDPFAGPEDRIRIEAADRGRAVALVARDLGGGTATLYADGEAVARLAGGGVARPLEVGEGTRLRVGFDGAADTARAGLAFYDATGEPAPGVAAGEVVFRQQVGGATLVDAAFSNGPAAVELAYDGDLGDLGVATSCPEAPRGAHLTVEVDGERWATGPCVWDGDRDPGGAGLDSPEPTGDQGRHTVRAFLTAGAAGPVLDDARVGLGLYATETTVVDATAVPTVVEQHGRSWMLDPAASTAIGTDRWEGTLDTDDSDLLIGLAGRADLLRVAWEGRLSRGSSQSFQATWGASVQGGLLLQGDSYRLRVRGTDVRTATLLVYRPL